MQVSTDEEKRYIGHCASLAITLQSHLHNIYVQLIDTYTVMDTHVCLEVALITG